MLATTCLCRRLGSALLDSGEWQQAVRLLAQDESEQGFPGVKVASLIESLLELAGPKGLKGTDITCRQLISNRYV